MRDDWKGLQEYEPFEFWSSVSTSGGTTAAITLSGQLVTSSSMAGHTTRFDEAWGASFVQPDLLPNESIVAASLGADHTATLTSMGRVLG